MKLNIPSMPDELEIISERSALIVVDMQNAFCKKEGLFGSIGLLAQLKVAAVIRNDIKVIAAARAKGLKIIYLRMGYGRCRRTGFAQLLERGFAGSHA
jgi:nicotinamidase-related amidase